MLLSFCHEIHLDIYKSKIYEVALCLLFAIPPVHTPDVRSLARHIKDFSGAKTTKLFISLMYQHLSIRINNKQIFCTSC